MSMQCKNIDEVVKNTRELLNNKDLQNEMVSNQEKYINANACEDICNIIINELEKNCERK
jgi:UDP-N-acetylglucosamine 2-epimerase